MSFNGRWKWLAVVAGLLPFALPAGAATSVQGNLGGRTYTAYVPDGPRPSAGYPVVIVLHGGGGSGERIARQTGFSRYVDQRRFIAVFPDAGGQQWNDGRETTRSGGNDVSFLVQVARDVTARGGTPQRVFVAGASNGGMMALRLACEASDNFTAFGIVIANMPTGLISRCRPSHAVPVIFFNSTTDPLMPWSGGQIRAGMMRGAGGSVVSTPETFDFWARVNGCSNEKVQNVPDRAGDGISVRLHSFGSCAGGSTLLYEIDGGGHTWPGGPEPDRPMVRRIVGPTAKDINATSAMLDFFSRYGL